MNILKISNWDSLQFVFLFFYRILYFITAGSLEYLPPSRRPQLYNKSDNCRATIFHSNLTTMRSCAISAILAILMAAAAVVTSDGSGVRNAITADVTAGTIDALRYNLPFHNTRTALKQLTSAPPRPIQGARRNASSLDECSRQGVSVWHLMFLQEGWRKSCRLPKKVPT